MGDTTTANYGWVMPAVGASADSWGTKLNDDLTSIDADLFTVATTYLPLVGGTLSGSLVVGGNLTVGGSLGINYSAFSGYWLAFGWDGSFPTFSVNGGGATGELATTGWVNGSFKPIGAYTPNQNVDYSSSPVFWNLTSGGTFYAQNGAANHQFSNGTFGGTLNVGGVLTASSNLSVGGTIQSGAGMYAGGSGVVYTGYGGDSFAFSWNGHLQSIVDGGWQGYVVRSNGSPYIVDTLYIDGGHNALFVQLDGSYHYVHTTYSSDRRLKSNIRPANIDALALINSIPVYECDIRYPGPDDRTTHWDAAVIADELEKVIPHAVLHPEPIEGESYAGISELPLLTTILRAVQQLSARVAALEAHA